MLQSLVKFGLSEKEARVYLALMELGPSSVTEVSKKSKVTRTNAYHLLSSLEIRGLVNSHENKGKMIYSAENPARIVQMLKDEIVNKKAQLDEAESILPELKEAYNDPEGKLKVRFYEGVEGVVSAYEDTLTSDTPIMAYASVEHQHAFFPGYFPEYYKRRTQKGIHVDCILAYTKESFRVKGLDKKHLRKTYIIPADFTISPEINIYDDKVAILSLKEKFAVIIQSKDVADAFKKLFRLAYERAGEYDEKLGVEYDSRLEIKDKRFAGKEAGIE
ncbi:MAG: helix-turn-helix domain-containing protein [Patescibacteria group bacterium]|nr:hypothetical protein [Patescibacteria group bacterium]